MAAGNEPGLRRLIELRANFREFHRVGDHLDADAALAESGVLPVRAQLNPALPEMMRLKLQGYGREWEARIAEAAVTERFSFYRAKVKIKIAVLEDFQRELEDALDTAHRGAILFAENDVESGGVTGSEWHSIWYFIFRTGLLTEDLGLRKFKGVLSEPEIFLVG